MKKVTMRTMAAILIIIGGILFVISGCNAKEKAKETETYVEHIYYLGQTDGGDAYQVEWSDGTSMYFTDTHNGNTIYWTEDEETGGIVFLTPIYWDLGVNCSAWD